MHAREVPASLLLSIALIGGCPGPAFSQTASVKENLTVRPASVPTLLAANATLGIGIGLVRCLFTGCHNLRGAAVRGAMGALVAFGGRGVASRDFFGAGLLGRQISLLGTAVMVGEGGGILPKEVEVALPGVTLRVRRQDAGLFVRPMVDLGSLATAAYIALQPLVEINWPATASSGTFVFRGKDAVVSDRGITVNGVTVATTVIMSDLPDPQAMLTLRHERVHVLQRDFVEASMFAPVETALARWTGLELAR